MINKTAPWFALTVVTALLLKYLHTISQTDDLMIILWPVSTLLELLLNSSSTYSESGFDFPLLSILLDKSCSGGNFFILTFFILSSTTPHYLFTKRRSLSMFMGTLGVSYLLTIAVVTLRIFGVVLLDSLESSWPWISTTWFSQSLKGLIYLGTLILAYRVLKIAFIKLRKLHHTYSNHVSV